MLNDDTLTRFQKISPGLLAPLHDYSFGAIPGSIERLLTGDASGPCLPLDCLGGSWPSPQRVVLILVDGFGWRFWQRYGEDSRVMRRVMADGVLTPISALFPSTTAASITTLNLGAPPTRHAVYEWNMYVPAFGETIQSLAFATLGDPAVSLEQLGHDVRDMVVEHETLHQRLAARGVASVQLAHRNYAGSPYNGVVSAGARIVRHATLPEALTQLEDALAATTGRGRALIGLYWAGLDTAAHVHGPGSRTFEAEARAFWSILDRMLEGLGDEETLFLITADHGHVGVPAERTLYLNERWPELGRWLARGESGKTILPNGSPRDVFLHMAPEHRSEALGLLRQGLGEAAMVMSVDDAIARGFFGPGPVSAELRRRLGDILVLPEPDNFIWWREPGTIGNSFHGHHGGLAADEIVTVVGALQGRM